MENYFYPNECIVCKKRTTLKRCSRCRMISYCGEVHQKNHWQVHREICKVISNLTREKKLSHLYEDLRDCTLSTWIDSRKAMMQKIFNLLGRQPKNCELEMLQYPRSCFVCYDTKQENLTNCANCPLVSFCQKHLDTTLHDKTCADIMTCQTLEFGKSQLEDAVKIMYISIFASLASLPNFKKLPTSTEEYLDAVLKADVKLDYKLKLYASLIVVYPLTIFGVLQKLNKTFLSKLTIYIHVYEGFDSMRQFIENLFHLLPNLEELKIVTNSINEVIVPGKLYLCSRCTLTKRKLTFQYYDERVFNESFDLIFISNLSPPDNSGWQYKMFGDIRHFCSKFTCPVVLTSSTELEIQRVKNYVQSVCHNHTIFYDGPNNFSSMFVTRNWEDWKVNKSSQFMIIAKSTKTSNSVEDVISLPESVTGIFVPSAVKSLESFYPGICQVCKIPGEETCKRCKMIFYCGQSHLKQNQSEHKDICKVILGLLKEKGTPHLFDKADIINGKSWLEAKLNFLKIARSKLNRDLLTFEKEIFLFPKTCFVCHESDLSVLKTCKCSVSLCKIHRDDTEHKNLCEYFQFNLKWGQCKEKYHERLAVSLFPNKRDQKLQPTMDQYVDRYFCFNNYRSMSTIQNPQKVIISDYLTRPLTFIFAVEKLRFTIPSTLYIHIVGALDEEFEHICYWHTVLNWFNSLRNLHMDFLGTEVTARMELAPKSTFHFLEESSIDKLFNFSFFNWRYDEFFKSVEFRKPDIIIGYNLNLHESNLGLSECTWKETVSIISKMNVPFIMTSKSEDRARKDHEMICSLLDQKINYDFFGKNPYASFMPERDYETERLCYSNNYVIAYNQLCKPSRKVESKNHHTVENENCVETIKIKTEEGKKISDAVAKSNVEKVENAEVKKLSTIRTSDDAVAKNNGEKVENNREIEKLTTVKVSDAVFKENVEKIKNAEDKKLSTVNSDAEDVCKLKILAEEEFSKVKVNNVLKEEKMGGKEEKAENSNPIAEDNNDNKKLLNEIMQLKEENRILKENLRLREENERLKNKISELSLK
ncbi:uncharacterized protein LOC122509579 [Leptopilina heterotoma]|uniref:uncharacterized protein LOC122509579 n=1 Tax=Leptopilina heterotoma TaxID=63436 RepID=UPI001CA93B0E|nr:uncharacterized protein LOC122509579 [Leptopilina heterotoma]